MLAETRAELDDFNHTSKELEAELENELARTEKAQKELRIKAERAESEREEWKVRWYDLILEPVGSHGRVVQVHFSANHPQFHHHLLAARAG